MKATRETKEGPFCIKLSHSDRDDLESLRKLLKEAVDSVRADPSTSLQIDFSGETKVPPEALRQLTVAGIALRRHGKKFAAIGIPEALMRQISAQGLHGLFEYPTSDPSKARTIDVEFVNPFVEGAIDTLRVQCGLATTAGALKLQKTFAAGYAIDIMAIIGLTSPAFTGSITLCFPQATFLKIMEGMIGESCPEITPEIRDGAGELLNIIFGAAKAKLGEKGYKIEKAIPSVIHGKEIQVNHMTSDLAVVLPFESQAGAFHMEIAREDMRGGSA